MAWVYPWHIAWEHKWGGRCCCFLGSSRASLEATDWPLCEQKTGPDGSLGWSMVAVLKFLTLNLTILYGWIQLTTSDSWQLFVPSFPAKEVKKAPVILEKLQNCGVPEGHPVRLECRVIGMPPPVFYWKKDNETIPANRERMRYLQGLNIIPYKSSGRGPFHVKDNRYHVLQMSFLIYSIPVRAREQEELYLMCRGHSWSTCVWKSLHVHVAFSVHMYKNIVKEEPSFLCW